MTKHTLAAGVSLERTVNRLIWVVAASVCFAMLLKFRGYQPADPLGLDPSWQVALTYAWKHGLQFGRDVVFPYGPLAVFYTQMYDPDVAPLWYGVRVLHAVAVAVAVVWTFRQRMPDGPIGRVAAAVLAILAAGAVAPGADAMWMLPAFMLFGMAMDDRDTPLPLLFLLVLLVAFSTLAKFSFLVISTAAMIGWTIAAAQRRDRLAFLAFPLFAVTVGVLWVINGQEFRNFPNWLLVSIDVARGYGPAMSLDSNGSDLSVFAILTLVMLAALWREFRADTPTAIKGVLVLGWLGMLMLTAKAGFVRHDGHAVFPFQVLIVTATLVVARLFPPTGENRLRFAGHVLLLVIAIGWVSLTQARQMPGRASFPEIVASRITRAPATLLAIPNDLLSNEGKAARYRATADRSRDLLGGPHPRIAAAASVDVHSYLISAPILAGLPYSPRPVIQSYQSYSPSLAALDVVHLREDGADVYVVHSNSIDYRPALADGGHLWPEFLSLYDPVGTVPLGLVLERRKEPIALETRTVFDDEFHLDDVPTELPAPQPGALLQIKGELKPTLLGQLVSLVFKPPQLKIVIRLPNGDEQFRRLVPGQLEAGFPISPLIDDTDTMREIFDGKSAGIPVEAIRIPASRLHKLFWTADFPLTVTEIRRPDQG